MATDAYIIGAYSTAFGKHTTRSYKELVREVFCGALEDSGHADGLDVDSCWFSNFTMHAIGQGGIRGQVCLDPLIKGGLFRTFAPIWNVENGCASGSFAFAGALRDVQGGNAQLSIAIGAEKLLKPESPSWDPLTLLTHGIDQLEPEIWADYFENAAQKSGKDLRFATEGSSIFMDIYATQAKFHMRKYGTTARQLAAAAAKSHNYGAENPKAQYQFRMTEDEVLADRMVSDPLTRSMCSPIGDGAAATVVCSEKFLRDAPSQVQERAVKVRACALASGRYRQLDDPSLTRTAATQAYMDAGVSPSDIDVAEVHDASSFSEIFQVEMLGFCPDGDGGRLHESGATGPGGRIPINTSGGLVSKGHPIGATGLSMLYELVLQLRGEAKSRQVANAKLGLAENGGGIMGFDEAACAVTILERN